MKNPKVSVLMPIYKTNEKYLRQAIESILKQTFTNFEFLILDDCPQDNKEKVVKSYADKRIKYLKNNQNMGITPSRNKLLEIAKGEYLAIMDHDDISLPTRFEKEVQFLDKHVDIGVVSCFHERIVSHEQKIYPIEHEDIIKGIARGGCYILHPASMIRKSVLIENNLRYEEEYSPCEDYMLWARLIQYTKFHNIPEFLFQYRDHDENTSHKQAEKMADKTQRIIDFINKKNPKLSGHRTTYFPHRLLPFICIKIQENKQEIRLLNFLPLLTLKKQKNEKTLLKILGIPILKINRRKNEDF